MGTMWCLYDPTPSDWCKTDVHSTYFGKERDYVYFNFPFAIKLAIGLNVFPRDLSQLGRISLPDSLLNSFHREELPNSENDILMFQQHQGESLSEAWTRFKDLL
ncbi:hypothetical protein Tco_0008928 [Tanacetum coccineum]